mgnify:CR=1 FL=1
MLMIHTADIHLGATPDRGEPWGKFRKEELWESFEKLIETVEKQRADLLLIAGDLFHRPPTLRELREVNDLFGTLTKTKVVLIAGNHDYMGQHSFYRGFSWKENVCFLGSERIESVKFSDLNVEVYGMSYHKREVQERLYDQMTPADNGYYHILLAHGGDEKHIPFTKEKIGKSSFDYVAFGHIHKPGMIVPGQAVMAGSLEPLDHTDQGVHGYVRVEVIENGNDISLIPFAKREYRSITLNLNEEDTMGSIYRALKERIYQEGEAHIYEVVLSGVCHSSLEIVEEKLKSAGNIRMILDKTEKKFDYEWLKVKYEDSLLGRYISSFENCNDSIEKEALQLGTAAILEAWQL